MNNGKKIANVSYLTGLLFGCGLWAVNEMNLPRLEHALIMGAAVAVIFVIRIQVIDKLIAEQDKQ